MNCNSKDGDDGCDYENKGEDENGDEDEDKDEDEGEDDDATATAITMLETTMTCTTHFSSVAGITTNIRACRSYLRERSASAVLCESTN